MSDYDEGARWSHPVVPEDRAPGELERRIGPLNVPYQVNHDLLGFHRRPENDGEVGHCLTYPAFWVPRWPDKDGKYGWGTAPQYAIRNDYGRYSLDEVLELLRRNAWDGKTAWHGDTSLVATLRAAGVPFRVDGAFVHVRDGRLFVLNRPRETDGFYRHSTQTPAHVRQDNYWSSPEDIIKNFGGTQEAKPMKVSETPKQPDPPQGPRESTAQGILPRMPVVPCAGALPSGGTVIVAATRDGAAMTYRQKLWLRAAAVSAIVVAVVWVVGVAQ